MLFTKNADGSVDLSGDIGDGYYDENWNYIPRDPALALLENFLIEQKGKPVEVTLTSDGGGYFTGQVFSSLFIRHGQVNLTLRGSVASAATLMLISAKKVKMYGGASVMIHRVVGGGRGNGEQLIKMGEFYQQLDRTVVSAYVEAIAGRNKLINGSADETTKKVKKLYDAETWLTAQEALDLGFVDEVLTAQSAGFASFIPFNKAEFKPLPPTEEEETGILRALAAPEFNDLAQPKELSVLKDFRVFAETVRAYKKSTTAQPAQKGFFESIKGAIMAGIEDAFAGFASSKETIAPEQADISNQSNQNQDSEMSVSEEKLKAMLEEFQKKSQESLEAVKQELSQKVEALTTENADLKQQVEAKEKAAKEAEAKAAADKKAQEDEQERLRNENTQQQQQSSGKPTDKQPQAVKKGECVEATAENFNTVLAMAHPTLHERLTKTGLGNRL